MYSLRASRKQMHSIRTTRTILPNKRDRWLDARAGNSAGCLTARTVTCGLVLCLRRSSLADNTGSSSLSVAAGAAAPAASAAWAVSLPAVGEPLANVDATVDVGSGLAEVTAGGTGIFGCTVDWVTVGAGFETDTDVGDVGTLSDERTSDAELGWTDVDGVGWVTPAQTTDVGVTLLATVDNEVMPVNALGNIVEGGEKGSLPGHGTYGGTP